MKRPDVINHPEREVVYMRQRQEFLRTIPLEYQYWTKLLSILDTPNPDPERYHDIGWRAGQLCIAQHEFSGTLLITSGDIHDILPWTQAEIDKLHSALARYTHA